MRNEKEKTPVCSNEPCGKPAEEESGFCAACGLEWMLLRRDRRREANVRGGPWGSPKPPGAHGDRVPR
jgi:hypothetical protein